MDTRVILKLIKIFWNQMVIWIGQFLEYTEDHWLHILKGGFLWQVNYSSNKRKACIEQCA